MNYGLFDLSSLLTNLQDEEIKDRTAKIEYAEQCLATLKLELKVRILFPFVQKQMMCCYLLQSSVEFYC